MTHGDSHTDFHCFINFLAKNGHFLSKNLYKGGKRIFSRKGEVFKKGEVHLERGVKALGKFFKPFFLKFLVVRSRTGFKS